MIAYKGLVAAAFTAGVLASPALAAPTIYFGANANPNFTVSGDPLTARNAFIAAQSGAVTTRSATFNMAFTGVNATLAGGYVTNANSVNTWAATPDEYFVTGLVYPDPRPRDQLVLTFDQQVSALGFYVTDESAGGRLSIGLDMGLSTERVFVLPEHASDAGNLWFWGIIDPVNTFQTMTFLKDGQDRMGVDDITVGNIGPATSDAPEPASWAMMIMGFGAVGGAMRARKKAISFA